MLSFDKADLIKKKKTIFQKSTGREKVCNVELFSDLMLSIERCQAELLEMMEEKQKAAEKQEEKLIQELQQEITELKMRNTELDHLLHTEDHLQLLQVSVSLSAHITGQHSHSSCWGISPLSCCRLIHPCAVLHTPGTGLRSVWTLMWVWRLWGELWLNCRKL